MKRLLTMMAVFGMLFAFTVLPDVSANTDTVPGGPSTDGNTNINSIITYDEMIKKLETIEATSKGNVEVFTLDDYGKSEQGNSIYVAKAGDGDKKIWVQAQIHGDEKLTTEAALQMLKTFASNGSPDVKTILEEATIYVIPMYNPDGSILNTRGTYLENEDRYLDLNRDWATDKFEAKESRIVYEYWTDLKPDFAIDLHHQGFKTVYGTNESTSFSLGISLAPDGPTLPDIKDGLYNTVTKQMQAYVYDSMIDYGYTHIDQYQVCGGDEKYFIDIRGGVVSAMMLGTNYNNLNDDGHSNPAIFFETKGNTREGNLGQKSNGYLTKQNYQALKALMYGIATEEIYDVDPERWNDIPAYPSAGYLTDYETSGY
ncbi:M14 family zinc carboxypeptidase [Thalassobacillus devorans]|uniref:M14 family zinc carboxypeptidase n=1 Tax=Thalassobacillus devorans TaxID=279813 RepID=UPI0020CB612F|nr:M14 family zinc carboxypeptidase [Thalassobacillus devorans]